MTSEHLTAGVCVGTQQVCVWTRRAGPSFYHDRMPEDLDVDRMIARFQARAKAVRQRGLPPVEGVERRRFLDQMKIDFQDYAMIGDAVGKLEDGILTLTVDLRPAPEGQGQQP